MQVAKSRNKTRFCCVFQSDLASLEHNLPSWFWCLLTQNHLRFHADDMPIQGTKHNEAITPFVLFQRWPVTKIEVEIEPMDRFNQYFNFAIP